MKVNKRNLLYVATPLLFMAGIAVGVLLGGSWNGASRKGDARYLELLRLISEEYVDTVDMDSLMEQSIPDLLSYLDPHSAYIPAADLAQVNSELEGSFSGVGISFQISRDTTVAIEIIPGGPAERAGLRAGDRIVAADTVRLHGPDLSSDKVMRTLRGRKGSKVRLRVKRPGEEKEFVYELTRDDVSQKSVEAPYLIEPGIGYVRVTRFASTTYQEFLQAVLQLTMQGAGKLIVDLRGNSGGYMDQAVLMANEFLPAGRRIVYTRGRRPENNMEARSDGQGSLRQTELAVLTDEFSASASEIFAGAVQDNDRGLVVGRRTFGKGLVQNQFDLPGGAAVRLTVARYFTPSGRSIQKEYTRGEGGRYDLDIVNRFNRGEFYSADSVRLDRTRPYRTAGGRTVYGGGGIMPDIFVPEDTAGFTSYYTAVVNRGLIPRYAMQVADSHRSLLPPGTDFDHMRLLLPSDETLVSNFADFAAAEGVPARWYYINLSRPLLLRQLQGALTRDLLGFDAYIRFLNRSDPVVLRAVRELKTGGAAIKTSR